MTEAICSKKQRKAVKTLVQRLRTMLKAMSCAIRAVELLFDLLNKPNNENINKETSGVVMEAIGEAKATMELGKEFAVPALAAIRDEKTAPLATSLHKTTTPLVPEIKPTPAPARECSLLLTAGCRSANTIQAPETEGSIILLAAEPSLPTANPESHNIAPTLASRTVVLQPSAALASLASGGAADTTRNLDLSITVPVKEDNIGVFAKLLPYGSTTTENLHAILSNLEISTIPRLAIRTQKKTAFQHKD